MVVSVSAEECREDSVTIPEEILACLDGEDIDTIFCVYQFQTGQFLSYSYEDFAFHGDVDSILANSTEPKLRRYYYVTDKAGETAVYTYDGESLNQRSSQSDAWYRMYTEQAENTIRTIDAGIVVENFYYLSYPDWTAIYYKTNLGDYVYVLCKSGEYLMARKPFLALQEELYELSVKYRDWRDMDNAPRQVKFTEIKADLSPYAVNSPDFDPHAPFKTNLKPGKFIAISSFLLLIGLVVCRFVIRGHWKNRQTKRKVVHRF